MQAAALDPIHEIVFCRWRHHSPDGRAGVLCQQTREFSVRLLDEAAGRSWRVLVDVRKLERERVAD